LLRQEYFGAQIMQFMRQLAAVPASTIFIDDCGIHIDIDGC